MANLLQCCALCHTDIDGYGPAGYPVYGDGMQMDGMPLDGMHQEMQDDYGPGMGYNSMARGYHDNY